MYGGTWVSIDYIHTDDFLGDEVILLPNYSDKYVSNNDSRFEIYKEGSRDMINNNIHCEFVLSHLAGRSFSFVLS